MKPSNLKVLHISNWYPNPVDNVDAQFIKDQIDALQLFAHCDVMHIQVCEGKFKWLSRRHTDRESCWMLFLPFKSWWLKEIATFFLLCCFLFLNRKKKYDVINFHIAYPLLTYLHLIARFIKKPMIVTEHWSAYRNNFGLKKELKRVKRIFRFQKNIITVSKSLARDIASFAGLDDLNFSILPNALSRIFQNLPKVNLKSITERKFFMVGCWQPPKRPLIVIEALSRLKSKGYHFNLRIGGYGPFEADILRSIKELQLEDCVEYIGQLQYHHVANELAQCNFLLHASDYETFSIVCLEALWQGVPVVASQVGGIPEFVNEKNGVLVSNNSIEDWTNALKNLTDNFDREGLQNETRLNYSNEAIGKRYLDVLRNLIENKNGKQTV